MYFCQKVSFSRAALEYKHAAKAEISRFSFLFDCTFFTEECERMSPFSLVKFFLRSPGPRRYCVQKWGALWRVLKVGVVGWGGGLYIPFPN